MDARQERGLVIVATSKIVERGIDKSVIILHYYNNDYSQERIEMIQHSPETTELMDMEVDMPRILTLTCKRCGHKWVPRISSPAVCPNCHSPYWNRPLRARKATKRKRR